MKNKLIDLNKHLFAEMERLSDEDLKGDKLIQEIDRARAFIDGNQPNWKVENLMLISRAELLVLNQHGYKETPDELKPGVLALSKLQVKTWGKEKQINA